MLGRRSVIFASVGSMLQFDRLVRAVDAWAGENPAEAVFIQIGDGSYEPQHAAWTRVMPMTDYRARLRSCALFVAHVGMGSILQAMEERKQMLLLPRLHALGEHTTDHQLHTAARFKNTKGICIVDDVPALHREMTGLLRNPLESGEAISDRASPALLAKVAAFLEPARTRH